MRIGLIAPPWVPVPPTSYGGTESIIDRLARGYAAAGHEVALFATGDSTCPVDTDWVFETSNPSAMGTGALEAQHILAAHDALGGMDVIHDHTVLGPLVSPRHQRPIHVSTVHTPFHPEVRALYSSNNHVKVVAISDSQRREAPSLVTRVIHHGLEVEKFPAGPGDGGYFLFLGRMTPDKGVHRAIHAARLAGAPLVIAAKMREAGERSYFENVVEPLLGGDVEYVGEVGTADRLELLQGARALLNPIRWREPFGLVMIESLAVGTPVLGYAEGAAIEIVDHGVTGLLCDSEVELAEAMLRVDSIDRRDCRDAVRSRFSSSRMVGDYLAFFEDLVGQRRGSPGYPAHEGYGTPSHPTVVRWPQVA